MSTNQLVIFTGEFGEPLVKLQDSDNGHQIPEMHYTEEWFSLASDININLYKLQGLLL